MPVYVTLFKFTDAASKNVNELPQRMEERRRDAELLGGKVLGLYITMGEYDFVSVVQWPNDETAAATSLAVSSRGNAHTTTMRAFTEAEFAEIARKLP